MELLNSTIITAVKSKRLCHVSLVWFKRFRTVMAVFSFDLVRCMAGNIYDEDEKE
jgi:hypothetical protein